MEKIAAVVLILSVVICGMIGNDCVENCMEKNSKDHTLRHGFFKGFRDDKNITDCTLAEYFDK